MQIRERWAALVARLRAGKRARDRLRSMRRIRVRLTWQTCWRCKRGWFAPASDGRLCGGCRR